MDQEEDQTRKHFITAIPLETEALRDQFARAALTGMLADGQDQDQMEYTVNAAYKYADAMLKERSLKKETP